MPLPKPNRGQLAVGVAFVIGVIFVGGLVWGFGRQLALAHQMRMEEIRLEQAVAAQQARHEDLAAQAEYVKCDEYVEHWARKDAGMVRSGEVSVRVIADEEPAADPQPTQLAEPETRPFWVEIWELIFGRAENP